MQSWSSFNSSYSQRCSYQQRYNVNEQLRSIHGTLQQAISCGMLNEKVKKARSDSRSHCWSKGVGAAPASPYLCSDVEKNLLAAVSRLMVLLSLPTGRKALLEVEFRNPPFPGITSVGISHDCFNSISGD